MRKLWAITLLAIVVPAAAQDRDCYATGNNKEDILKTCKKGDVITPTETLVTKVCDFSPGMAIVPIPNDRYERVWCVYRGSERETGQ